MMVPLDNTCFEDASLEANFAFKADVLSGLAAQQKAVPARWLYDRRGSELFEEITALPEYYPTRSEMRILKQYAGHMAKDTGPGRVVVEFGSGSSAKTPLLLSAIDPSAYVAIDISGAFLHDSVATLSSSFPHLPMYPVVADFMRPLQLPDFGTTPRLGFFPGSTIGNLVAATAVDLLRAMARTLGCGAQLLIGIDRVKSTDVLLPAYADSKGVTAEFNLNLLRRINRELDGTIPPEAFRHRAYWNESESRIEMHLEAIHSVSFEVAGCLFRMEVGETIHTENSVKYGARDARVLLSAGGWTLLREWTDPEQLFSMMLAEVTPPRHAP
jgi:L-histidine N-alpha-methyltransferase